MFEKELQEASEVVKALEQKIEALEKLVNGKAGFLKEVKKKTTDDAIHRLGEDIFVLKMFGRFIKNTVGRICTLYSTTEKLKAEIILEVQGSLVMEQKPGRETYVEEVKIVQPKSPKMSNAIWELKKNQLETLLASIVSELKKENLISRSFKTLFV